MAKYKVSSEGFVLPDFDFESLDAIIPVSTPSITPYVFDTTQEFRDLVDAIKQNNMDLIYKHLILFRTAVIDNSNDIPEELFYDFSVPQILMNLIDPVKYPQLLYASMCAAIAWSGAQSRDSDTFNNQNFINFLIELTIVAISDPKFTGNRKIGNAALGLLRNLVYNSNDIRIIFIKSRGIELFSSLFLEITDPDIDKYIIWTLQNALLVEPKPLNEHLKGMELVLRSSFRFYMKGVDPSEIRLAIAYANCGPSFAISLMKNVDFEIASNHFIYAMPDTQVMILELFETLALYPDQVVASIADEKIKWNEFITKIPFLYDKRLNKKFISVVSNFFNVNYRPIYNTHVIKSLLNIFKTSCYTVKIRVNNCLKSFLDSNPKDAIATIAYNNVIEQVIKFLDDDDCSIYMAKFFLELLYHLIKFAQEDSDIRERLIKQSDIIEFGPFIEEFCLKEQNENVSNLADAVMKEFQILSDIYDDDQMRNSYEMQQRMEQENNFDDPEKQTNFENINYEELSKMHQNPDPHAFYMMNEAEEEEDECSDGNEEEDVWVDVDDVDIDNEL